MTDIMSLILAIIVSASVIYYVDDGRIRLGVLALLAAFVAWRNRPEIPESSNPVKNGSSSNPTPPDTEKLDEEIADTDTRLESIDDTRPGGNVGAGLGLLDQYDRDTHGG